MFDTDLSTTLGPARTVAEVAGTLGHPDDVLSDTSLTGAEKREILSAWASDAHAVPDRPTLRQLPSGAVVEVADALRALRALDGSDPPTTTPERPATWRARRRPSLPRLRLLLRRRDDDDDDDDPPPAPAGALPFGVALARRRKWDEGVEPEPVAA